MEENERNSVLHMSEEEKDDHHSAMAFQRGDQRWKPRALRNLHAGWA